MEQRFTELKAKATKELDATKKFFERLKKKTPKDLDDQFLQLHEQAFGHIDCLKCANCCKTTGPLFLQKDIERLAKHLKMKPGDFITRYLHMDEDGDFVLNVLPCPFLGADNYCSVYDARPNACREYPHTNQRKMHTIFKETLNNTLVCPAVFEIVEKLKSVYP
ncbi:MAG: YkgJ family cysteine cluster protein [Bacteroidota bacterium]|jgi:Fe-S-cluster containining protein|nr:YkgJ family cysteine cluster protein [Sphingobacteriales bacterium]